MIKKTHSHLLTGIGIIFYLFVLGFMGFFVLQTILLNASIGVDSVIPMCVVIGFPSLLGTTFTALGLEERKRRKFVRSFAIAILSLYSILLLSVLFGGFRQHVYAYKVDFLQYMSRNCNFIPFRTIIGYIQALFNNTINVQSIIDNIFGNLILFAPMGLLLPAVSASLQKWHKFILTLLIILVGVEILQLILQVGSCDIDDVILNFAGAFLVFCIIKSNMINELLAKIYVIDKHINRNTKNPYSF